MATSYGSLGGSVRGGRLVSTFSVVFALFAASLEAASAQRADTSQAPKAAAPADTAGHTAPDSGLHVAFGGFVDVYYAYDFQRPRRLDRPFMTQAVRHNEFNVNLAFVEAKFNAERIRGRLALQTGTSVQANYAGEPRLGAVSGPELSRLMQEAYLGLRIAPGLWVDGGIFFSHMGMESWISSENPTYTRSLVAEYSPYYQAGARLTWQGTPTFVAQLDVINGWQNISENNSDKAVGIRLDYQPTSEVMLSYYNFFGNEQPDTVRSRLRVFNGIGAKVTVGLWQFLAQADYGWQRRADGTGGATWYGGTLIARYQLTPSLALVGRVERYDDGEQTIVVTENGQAFRVSGASLAVDVAPMPHVLWRLGGRGFMARNPVFPSRAADGSFARRDGFIFTSLAVTF